MAAVCCGMTGMIGDGLDLTASNRCLSLSNLTGSDSMTDKLGSERIEDAISRLQYDSMIWSAIDYANGYIKHHPTTAKDNNSLTTNRFRITNGLGGTTADLNTVLKMIGLIYYNPTKKLWEPSPVYKDTNICTTIQFPDGKCLGWTRKGQLMLQYLLTDLGVG